MVRMTDPAKTKCDTAWRNLPSLLVVFFVFVSALHTPYMALGHSDEKAGTETLPLHQKLVVAAARANEGYPPDTPASNTSSRPSTKRSMWSSPHDWSTH